MSRRKDKENIMHWQDATHMEFTTIMTKHCCLKHM